MAPFRLGFRVCDRRHPFLWSQSGQPGDRWNRPGDPPRHSLASSPLVAWAEWLPLVRRLEHAPALRSAQSGSGDRA